MRRVLLSSERGFSLIELLAVMAIVGILAAVVVPAVSGTSEASRDAQTQQDATSLDTASAEFFNEQRDAEILKSHKVELISLVNGVANITSTQTISSRWPEKLITAEDLTKPANYLAEFPTVTDTTITETEIELNIADLDGNPISGADLLAKFTAVDFDKLVGGGFAQKQPNTLDGVSRNIHNYLWLFKKQSSASGTGQDDSRKSTVFKLVTLAESEVDAGASTLPAVTTKFVLTYEQIF